MKTIQVQGCEYTLHPMLAAATGGAKAIANIRTMLAEGYETYSDEWVVVTAKEWTSLRFSKTPAYAPAPTGIYVMPGEGLGGPLFEAVYLLTKAPAYAYEEDDETDEAQDMSTRIEWNLDWLKQLRERDVLCEEELWEVQREWAEAWALDIRKDEWAELPKRVYLLAVQDALIACRMELNFNDVLCGAILTMTEDLLETLENCMMNEGAWLSVTPPDRADRDRCDPRVSAWEDREDRDLGKTYYRGGYRRDSTRMPGRRS